MGAATVREGGPCVALDWEPAQRQLIVFVSHVEHEPAVDAIALALGLGAAGE